MKRFTAKKWLACLLALCTLLALCACGGTSGKTEPVAAHKDPKTVMDEARQKMEDVKSISFDMEMQMTMGAQGQTMDMGVTMSADTIKEPLQAHVNMRMDMFGMDTEMYMVREADGSLVTYTGLKEGGKVAEWYKATVSADDLEGIQAQVGSYDADSSFSTQLDIADNLKEIGVETVNGKNATRYDGVIHGSDIGKALGQTNMADTLSIIGLDPTQLDQDVPISIWIYEDGMPAKYDIDMTDLLAQLFAQSEETADAEVSAVRMSMTITGVDTVSEIVIPQEALDAEEVPLDDPNFGDTGDDPDMPWNDVQLGETFTLPDGTELNVSSVTNDPENGVIVVDAGLTDPDKAPLAMLICSEGEMEVYQLENYTIDDQCRYVFSMDGHENLTVYAVVLADGEDENANVWLVDMGLDG